MADCDTMLQGAAGLQYPYPLYRNLKSRFCRHTDIEILRGFTLQPKTDTQIG